LTRANETTALPAELTAEIIYTTINVHRYELFPKTKQIHKGSIQKGQIHNTLLRWMDSRHLEYAHTIEPKTALPNM